MDTLHHGVQQQSTTAQGSALHPKSPTAAVCIRHSLLSTPSANNARACVPVGATQTKATPPSAHPTSASTMVDAQSQALTTCNAIQQPSCTNHLFQSKGNTACCHVLAKNTPHPHSRATKSSRATEALMQVAHPRWVWDLVPARSACCAWQELSTASRPVLRWLLNMPCTSH